MTIEQRIAQLQALSAAQKKAEWRRVFGTPAPPAFGTALLVRALAAHLQEQALAASRRPNCASWRFRLGRTVACRAAFELRL